MDSQDEIRQRIRARLDELDIKVKPTSIAAGLGETTLRNFLDGMTKSLTVDTVERLAPALKVSARWILFGETAEVTSLWDRIPDENRPQALNILRTFVRDAG